MRRRGQPPKPVSKSPYCAWCGKELIKRQRVYCSRSCQGLGLGQRNITKTETRICAFCDKEYIYHPDWKSDANSRYCKRECKDAHQKITYRGEGNPSYGRLQPIEERERRAIAANEYWSLPENIERHCEVMRQASKRSFETLGYHHGQSAESCEQRKQTYIDVYGDHPWRVPEIRQKAEETTLRLYGKHSWELGRDAIKKHTTSIELIVSSSLETIGVEFVHLYTMTSGSVKKEFDFYVPKLNTLIEADGDYWHANPSLYNHNALDQAQQYTHANDIVKDAMALSASVRLLRFWESDIKQTNFAHVLTEALWAKN